MQINVDLFAFYKQFKISALLRFLKNFEKREYFTAGILAEKEEISAKGVQVFV